MSIAMAGFTFNDALLKFVLPTMNLGQAVLVRGVFATALLFLLVARQRGPLRFGALLHPSVLIRLVCEVAATITFVLALMRLPLADVSAVLQALPLAVTLGAAFIFSEPVGWRRWLAILGGFVGVMIVVRPGFEGFNAWSLSALVTVGFCAVRDLSTHSIPREVPTAWISAATSLAVMLCGVVLIGPFGGWSPLTLPNTAALFGSALALVFGYQFIIKALREGDISFMAPFRYTALLWAIALGYLLFGDVPDGPMLLGSALIVVSGLYALYRERVAGRQQPIIESTEPNMAPDGL